jgi:50S ribosomal protein L16 3-hydroxylase
MPLLVRGAFPHFADPLTKAQVLRLAADPDAQARLVRRAGRHWSLEHGPFPAAGLRALPRRDWTVLVQDTNHFSAAADALLARFAFLPHARVDDLMVSYAVPGGSVGPHVDSYDVFLIQGRGQRLWKISRQKDLAFVPGLDLRILARFVADEEWLLGPGDMLYLPPGVAHYGIAKTECLTWSVGFRAPSDAQFASAFLDQLGERLALAGRYRDPGVVPARHPGEIPPALVAHVRKVVNRIRWRESDARDLAGRFLSEPKAHVYFKPPARPMGRERFARLARREGLRLDGRARLLYSRGAFFLNGERVECAADCAPWLRTLADGRRLLPGAKAPARFWNLAHDWHARGFVHPGEEEE